MIWIRHRAYVFCPKAFKSKSKRAREQALFTSRNDEFHVKVAKDIEEACKLVEAGFEYVTGYDGGNKIFRKRK